MNIHSIMKQFANLTTTLLSQPGATNLELSHSAVNSRGVSLHLGEDLSQFDHTVNLMTKGENTMTNRMTFTIEEEFTAVHGWAWIGYERCPVCLTEVLSIVDNDPGSVEAAVGVHHVCEHPICRELAGAAMLICGSETEELLSKDTYTLSELSLSTTFVQCDGADIRVASILGRRYAVEYVQDKEKEQDFYIDNRWDDEPDYDDGHVDLETEKWNNYWGDYNQCGIRVGY